MTRRLAVALALTGAGAAAGVAIAADARTGPQAHSGRAAAEAPAHGDGAPARLSASAAACQLRMSDARSGRELQRLPLDPSSPEIRIAFEHSVLGTTVIDRFRFTPSPLLVEEEFEGEGYGLPAMPGPGERLERVGTRQRLTLSRPVDPLIVRALTGPRTRLLLDGDELLLSRLGAPSVAFEAIGCTP